MGTSVVNAPELLLDLSQQFVEKMDAEGVEVRWLVADSDDPGLFTWTWRASFVVTGFHAIPERSVEQTQAGFNAIFWAVVGLLTLALVGWIYSSRAEISRNEKDTLPDKYAAYSTIAIAASLIALVYLLSKRP